MASSKVSRRNDKEHGLLTFPLLPSYCVDKTLPKTGVSGQRGQHARWSAQWQGKGNLGRKELEKTEEATGLRHCGKKGLGPSDSQPGDMGGETGGGGRTFLSRDKRKSHNCFVLRSGAGGRLYLPEGLRSLWQPHIWAPGSRCAVSRSHSRMMRQTLGSPVLAPTARERTELGV